MTTTHNPASACPEPEVIGAFVEGRLGAWKRWKMTRHLDRCETCREDVAALTNFVVAPAPANVVRFVPASARGWWIAAAASLVTIVGVAVFRQALTPHRDKSPIAPLVAASARLGYRSIEARLSGGFEWAELRGPVRSSAKGSNPKQQQLIGEAGKVLEQADANPEDAPVQHAAAIASLLTDDPRVAVERLDKLTKERPNDAHVWNDLAAAHHAAAIRFGTASEEPLALAAIDRAIELDPQLAEARFNRALILEKLGALAQAREAWQQYLDIDATSAWAKEARTRRDAISTTTSREQFRKEWPQFQMSAAAGDARFVARYPEESRMFAENRTLSDWAAAYQKGDAANARRQLSIARTVGDALKTGSGEHLLSDLVSTIDRASDSERARLAEGYEAFQQGYAARGKQKYAAARSQFLRAAILFGETPGATWARYYAADAGNSADEVETALSELDELSARVSDRYKALIALIEVGRGLAEAKLVRWPKAIEHYDVALALFTGLRERSNAAYTSSLIGEASSLLGRRDAAWTAWTAALRTASESALDYVPRWINMAATSESLSGHREAAMALFDLALREHHTTAASRAAMLFRRAILSARAGRTAEAVRFIAEGKRDAAAIPELIPRQNALTDLDVAEGIAYASSEPQRALDSLTRAVEMRHQSWQALLPPTFLERARVLRSLGRADEAMADLESAVALIESQRGPVPWKDTSSDALDGADEIYTTLAELLLERGKTREAFMTTDRAAAHAFYGAGATGFVERLDALQQRLGPGTLVVEYLVLPQKTVVFVAGQQVFQMRETEVASTEVARRFRALDRVLREPSPVADVQRASAELHEILIAPVRDLLRSGTTIAFVPDPLLASVSFPALFDASTGRWLAEEHATFVVPSALYHDNTSRSGSRAVVAIRPATNDVNLPQTPREIDALTRLYPQARVLEGAAATVPAMLDAIRDAGIIHYAGHTANDEEAGLSLGAGDAVYGADITRNPLRGAPLVVLAGCRTLRGGARREDLASSLARAFLLAGARSVVGTTWDVDDDAAAAFFTRFHESNATSGDAVAALWEAQRFLLQHRQRHPSDWAFAQIVVRAL
jgi:CHAT domain-containing protein/predicted negative regulator of RcsB-dependent stress response